MPKTPPAISLIGISLTVLALAVGSWLGSANTLKATIDWPTDITVEVNDDFAQVDQTRPSAPAPTDCSEPSERLT